MQLFWKQHDDKIVKCIGSIRLLIIIPIFRNLIALNIGKLKGEREMKFFARNSSFYIFFSLYI